MSSSLTFCSWLCDLTMSDRCLAQTSPSPPLLPGPQHTKTLPEKKKRATIPLVWLIRCTGTIVRHLVCTVPLSGKHFAMACAHDSPASSMSWSTEKAYSLNSSWSSLAASSWPSSLTGDMADAREVLVRAQKELKIREADGGSRDTIRAQDDAFKRQSETVRRNVTVSMS